MRGAHLVALAGKAEAAEQGLAPARGGHPYTMFDTVINFHKVSPRLLLALARLRVVVWCHVCWLPSAAACCFCCTVHQGLRAPMNKLGALGPSSLRPLLYACAGVWNYSALHNGHSGQPCLLVWVASQDLCHGLYLCKPGATRRPPTGFSYKVSFPLHEHASMPTPARVSLKNFVCHQYKLNERIH